MFTVPALQKTFVDFFYFPSLPGNFALKNAGDFRLIFSGLRFPSNKGFKHENCSKNPGKIRSKIRGKIREENSGQNSGNFRSTPLVT